MKKMQARVCTSCNASDFLETTENGRHIFKCRYCGTTYEDDITFESTSQILKKESISGVGQVGTYIVHERLNVSGMNNHITLSKVVPENATEVKKLNVSGMNHRLVVHLMPKASKCISGMNNFVG